jgi:hypothetical protein
MFSTLVGVLGLEPRTSASQTQHASQLRHTPLANNILSSNGSRVYTEVCTIARAI